MLDKALRKSGYQTFTTTDPFQALQRLDETTFDAAILDVKLERISGLKVLERIKAHDETIQVVILAGAEKERFETALAALRMGAHDFLMKPMRNIQDLLASVWEHRYLPLKAAKWRRSTRDEILYAMNTYVLPRIGERALTHVYLQRVLQPAARGLALMG